MHLGHLLYVLTTVLLLLYSEYQKRYDLIISMHFKYYLQKYFCYNIFLFKKNTFTIVHAIFFKHKNLRWALRMNI